MEKPIFILFMGMGWCGTTSLWHTLKNNNYIHTGYQKETYILSRGICNICNVSNKPKPMYKHVRRALDEIRSNPSNIYRYDQYYRILYKIPEQLEYDILENPTLEKYIEYYKILSDNRNPYHAVGDFTNLNISLPLEFLKILKEKLEKYFTIKVLYIHRDPVRRLFSATNHYYYNEKRGQEFASAEEFLLGNLKSNPNGVIYKPFKNIKRNYSVFDEKDTHHVFMETFFQKGNVKEVRRLEKFLKYTLPIITECAFVPDRGINAPKNNEELRDQWESDHEILTPEFYNIIREKQTEVYNEYQELFGDRLPEHWGEPIEYS